MNEDVVFKTDHLILNTDSLVWHRQSLILLLMKLFTNSFEQQITFLHIPTLRIPHFLLKWKTKKYSTDGTVPNQIEISYAQEAKSIYLTHLYRVAHCSGLLQVLQ